MIPTKMFILISYGAFTENLVIQGGFTLCSFVIFVTVDINECLEYNDCHQICSNTEGSYECSCDTGFVLKTDNRTCKGNFNRARTIYLIAVLKCFDFKYVFY